MNIENALRLCRPEPKFFGSLMSRYDYDNRIDWADTRPKPTWDELVAANAEAVAAQAAETAATEAELVAENAMRTKHGLNAMKRAKLADLEAATKAVLDDVGGTRKALEMLAMAVALIDRRLSRRGI